MVFQQTNVLWPLFTLLFGIGFAVLLVILIIKGIKALNIYIKKNSKND